MIRKIINFILIFIVPIALFDLNPFFSNSITRMLLLLLSLLVIFSKRISITKNIVIFLIFSVISLFVSLLKGGSLKESTLIFEQFVYFLVLYNAFENYLTIKKMIKAIVITGVILSIGGILEYIYPNIFRILFDRFLTTDSIIFYENTYVRPKTVFINPIFYSFYISISLLLGISVKMRNILFKVLFLALHITALILAYSSGAIILLAIVLLYFQISKYKSSRILLKYVYISLFFATFSILILYYIDLSLLVNIITERVYAWRVAIRMYFDGNFFGVGLGNFNTYYSQYDFGNPISYYFNIYHTHNEFLKILVEMGFIAMMLFIWIFIDLLNKSAVFCSEVSKRINISWVTSIHLVMLFIFLYSMIENFIMAFRSQLVIIIVFALIEWLDSNKQSIKEMNI